MQVGYRANLWLRSAIRVLVLLSRGRLDPRRRGAEEIYRFARESVDWPKHLHSRGMCFSVSGTATACTDVRSSLLLSTRVKDGICDSMADEAGYKPRPPPKGEAAQLQLVATAHCDDIALYRNMSGDSLHRRGYREAMHRASLNESVAAGALLLMGWEELCHSSQGVALADPMCGSGTFLIEAALIAERRAPGLMRRSWPFESWHDFDEEGWRQCCEEARGSARRWDGEIWGSDLHEGALWLAKRDIEDAGMQHVIKLKLGDVRDTSLPHAPSMVITNPPWGQRLEGQAGRDGRAGGAHGDEAQLRETWTQLGLFLKRECRNARVGVVNGANKAITRELCLKAERRYPLTIGGVDARLLRYHILPEKPAGARAAAR